MSVSSKRNRENQELVSFKVDQSLKKLLAGTENRSEFIRNAIMSALENACPVCSGAGVVTPHRLNHLNDLIANHDGKSCSQCNDPIL